MSINKVLRRNLSPLLYRSLGIDIFGKLRWLTEASKWSNEQRRQWRLVKLNGLLNHCWKNVPFYREYWGDHRVISSELKSVQELDRYPLVTSDQFRHHRDLAISENVDSIPHKMDSTGGTTGAPLRYLHDLDLHALRYANQILGWGFGGYEFGDEVFIVAGGSLISGKTRFRNRVRSWLEAKKGLYCLQMDDALAKSCWEAMCEQKTKLLIGYPSTLSLLCTSLRNQNLVLPKLKSVVTTAEMLLPHYRKTIEDYTEVKVFDHYGCNDGGLLSYECEQHKGLHYNDYESVLEVIDPNASGVGELAITNLWNRSMPFVRYLNGDLLSLSDGLCDCGRKFPLINQVQGRTADILTFPNGKNLTGPGVTLIFKDLPVEAWQAVQTDRESLEIRLCAEKRLQEDEEKYIFKVLHQHLGSGAKVSVKYVDALSVTNGGKLKPVFSEVGED